MTGPGKKALHASLAFEHQAWQQGHRNVAGVDEVGRGPLAGPVVAAAVILPRNTTLPAVADSKALTHKQRCDLFDQLYALPGFNVAVAAVDATDIDRINILQATMLAMRSAILKLDPPPDYALIDGNRIPEIGLAAMALVKGDARSASIAAASIVAKVTRDRMMAKFDDLYPGYGFAQHKGYGTKAHLAALCQLGPCPIHRKRFAPVANLLNGGYVQMQFDL